MSFCNLKSDWLMAYPMTFADEPDQELVTGAEGQLETDDDPEMQSSRCDEFPTQKNNPEI